MAMQALSPGPSPSSSSCSWIATWGKHGDAGAEGVRGPAVAAVPRRAHLLFFFLLLDCNLGMAVLILCKANRIDFEEVTVDLFKAQHRTPEFTITYVQHTTLGPSLGLTPNPETAKEGEKLLSRSLRTIETVWLKGDAKFLNGNPQPSIADLSLVCEIMQLEVVGDERHDSILRPHEKVRAWMENVKKATSPHFDEVHELIFKLKARLSLASHLKPASKL